MSELEQTLQENCPISVPLVIKVKKFGQTETWSSTSFCVNGHTSTTSSELDSEDVVLELEDDEEEESEEDETDETEEEAEEETDEVTPEVNDDEEDEAIEVDKKEPVAVLEFSIEEIVDDAVEDDATDNELESRSIIGFSEFLQGVLKCNCRKKIRSGSRTRRV